MPYSQPQANLLDAMIDRINAEPLAFTVHVGDITSGRGPCDDEWLEARKRQFARFRHPFVLLPGDNDWTDCHRSGFEPLERLNKWRSLFCVPVEKLSIQRQDQYCENVRWVAGNVVFVGLNVPGSNNNLTRDPLEHGERMRAVLAWLDEAEALARGRDGLVVLLQANPFLEPRLGGANGYEALLGRLRRLGASMPGKAVLVHGDTHRFRDDEPLPGLRRVEVFGSPHVRWLRARRERGGAALFAVEPMPPP
ncbi:MAG: hypothetical protein AB1452_13740 [Pseudomonadota bacterium]